MTAKKTYVLFCNHTGCAATFTTLGLGIVDTVGSTRHAAAAERWTSGLVRARNGVTWVSGDWCPDHRADG